jgi:hypothetical protein
VRSGVLSAAVKLKRRFQYVVCIVWMLGCGVISGSDNWSSIGRSAALRLPQIPLNVTFD